MEFRVLKYFLAVAREENISAAAERLHVTQPTLSRQLMDLEAELGKTLFKREHRRISLTEEGMLLRKRAEEIIDLVDKTEAEVMNLSLIHIFCVYKLVCNYIFYGFCIIKIVKHHLMYLENHSA